MKKWACVWLVLLVGAFALAGCAGQDDDLVGTWHWEEDSGFYITFHDDGTGSRNWFGEETFRWSTSGSRLNINRDENPGGDYVQNERWDYTLTRNRVVFDSRQDAEISWTYVR